MTDPRTDDSPPGPGEGDDLHVDSSQALAEDTSADTSAADPADQVTATDIIDLLDQVGASLETSSTGTRIRLPGPGVRVGHGRTVREAAVDAFRIQRGG